MFITQLWNSISKLTYPPIVDTSQYIGSLYMDLPIIYVCKKLEWNMSDIQKYGYDNYGKLLQGKKLNHSYGFGTNNLTFWNIINELRNLTKKNEVSFVF